MDRRDFIKRFALITAAFPLTGRTSDTLKPITLNNENRLVFLEIETTGLMPEFGHRIVEVAAIEYINKRPSGKMFHSYLNPEREIDPAAQTVHGLSLRNFLDDKPRFSEIAEDLQKLIAGAGVVIHNAPFSINFLDNEFKQIDKPSMAKTCKNMVDTFRVAKKLRPDKNCSLDALCLHYGVDTTMQTFHGALLNASLLAQVYFEIV